MSAFSTRFILSVSVSFRQLATTSSGQIGGRRMGDASAHQQNDVSRSGTTQDSEQNGGGDGPANVPKTLRSVDMEAEQIQEYFRRRNSSVDPRDQFGSIAAQKVHMPQTERIQYGFQPDIWNEGAQIEQLLHERQNAVMADEDYVMDEFAEGLVPQIVEPAKGTCPGLKKHARIKRRRAESRALERAERQRTAVATDPGCE